MQPDSRRLADTASWLRKASNDLRYAGIDLAAEPAASEDAVFHCQQAVEKALKAFLVWSDGHFPKHMTLAGWATRQHNSIPVWNSLWTASWT